MATIVLNYYNQKRDSMNVSLVHTRQRSVVVEDSKEETASEQALKVENKDVDD